jgi:hypothetical protein
MAEWLPWDLWLARRGLSAATWPTAGDNAPPRDYQRLDPHTPPGRPGRRSAAEVERDRDAERELLRRLLEG